VNGLEALLAARQEQEIVEHILELVPEYRPSAKWDTARWKELVPTGTEYSSPRTLSAQGVWMQ
jgi:hypothetical protein